MRLRRVVFWLGVAIAVAIGIRLRLYTKEQLTQGERVRPLTSDDNYHMRRARFAVADYPHTIVFDPLMNFPDGGVPIWPPLFDVALATPARVLDGPNAPAAAVERRAAGVPLVFAAGAILLAGVLGRRLFGDTGGAAAALFVALCPGHLLWTQYGHTDQHVAESFFGLLVLVLFLCGRDETDGRRKLSGEIVTGLALGVAVLAWQGAIYWGAILALSLFLEAAAARRATFREAAMTLGLAAAVAAAGTAFWLGPRRAPFTYISFGWFQPLFLAALAGGTILCEAAVAFARGERSGRNLAWRAALIAFFGALVLPNAAGLVTGLLRGLGYAAGSTPQEIMGDGGYLAYPRNWLKGIFEAQPLLAGGPGPALYQLSAAFFLAPLAVCAWVLRAVRRQRPATHVLLAVWGTVTLFLSLSQKLNVYYAAPLAAVCCLTAARLAGERLGKLAPGQPLAAPAAAVATALALALPMAVGLRREVQTVPAPETELFAALEWMRAELPRSVDAYDPRLLGPPPFPPEVGRAASVLAPWALGHRILYVAEQPVVGNNFGYGFSDSLRFFLASSEDEALAIAKKRRARWVFTADLLPRMNDYAATLGRSPLLRNDGRGLVAMPDYFRTLQARLFDFEGQAFEAGGVSIPPLSHFRRLYRSKSAVPRGDHFVAQWKVFEIVE
jgi:dolichyl-diphosphooligosaccharide--protein glycosyltransferase